MLAIFLAASIVASLLVGGVVGNTQQYDPNIAKTILSLIDFTVDPCDDFYHYACGTWINETILPKDKSRYTRSFDTIEKSNKAVLLSVVSSSSYSPALYEFFQSCMDMDAIDSLGYRPIVDDLVVILNVEDGESLMGALVELTIRGVDAFFSFGSTVDAEDPSIVIAQFDQGGLGLPYPSLYTSSDPHSQTIRQEYQNHIYNTFKLIGNTNPEENAQLAYSLEYEIAQFTIDGDQLTNPFTTYNKMTIEEFILSNMDLPWAFYFAALSTYGIDVLNVTVTVPTFFGNLSEVLPMTQKSWQAYLMWTVLRTRSPFLSTPLRNEHFNFFNRILSGQEQPAPLDEQCIDVIDASLGELLGNFFNEIAFPGASETAALKILADIISAMHDDISNITWMDTTTQSQALLKLSKVAHLIGAPENPDNYSAVNITSQFFDNVIESTVYNRFKSLAKIGMPSVRTEWGITAPTVNAYYDPSRNIMVFPSGILQQPFFNVSYPTALNYGAIGLVMGHELTHGFDNQGRLYNGDGQLINWWDNTTNDLFNSKVQCVIDQYSKFSPIPGVFVNGKLTQGENIADMGGAKNSFHAYSRIEDVKATSFIPQFTNGQVFFLSFAQSWCEKITDARLRIQVQTDPHSPAMFRVLGPLMNLPDFADVWNCPVGSKMNDPNNRCQVW